MVELDYLFDDDIVASECVRPCVLSDFTLIDSEMLVRLRIGEVEVFGQSEEDYHHWIEQLRRHQFALHVPSPAWTLLSVLSIAVSVKGAFRQLHDAGYTEIDSLDCRIYIVRAGDDVVVQVGRDRLRVGRTSYKELYEAFTSFAERVRRDYLSICPQLDDHLTLGPWFRGDADGSTPVQPPEVILL